jgi:hypothetical protein
VVARDEGDLMQCPTCSADTKVTETRVTPIKSTSVSAKGVRRRRACTGTCNWRGTTYEVHVPSPKGGKHLVVALLPERLFAMLDHLASYAVATRSLAGAAPRSPWADAADRVLDAAREAGR